MGWTWQFRGPGTSDRDWFQENVVGEHHEIVDCATVRFVFYAAVRDKRDDTVWGLVCLTGRNPSPYEHFNYGYKDMSDTMGPGEDYAPRRIIEKLTPTDSEWANDWRKRCLANADRADLARKVKPGMTLKFKHKIPFSNGSEHDTFEFAGRSTMLGPDGVRYRIPRWRQYQFEIVERLQEAS